MAAINSRELRAASIVPRLLTQSYGTGNDLYITLEGTIIKVTLVINGELPTYVKQFDVKLWREGEVASPKTYLTDWWNTVTSITHPDDVLSGLTSNSISFDLLNMKTTATKRRISQAGVNYQIAYRAIDTTNNYSNISVLGSILIKTIS